MAATSPIKDTKQIAGVKDWFLKNKKIRDYVLFVVGINTALRIGDILSLVWADVYDFERNRFRTHLVVKEQKTGKKNCVALNAAAVDALKRLFDTVQAEKGSYIFLSRKGHNRHISRNRAYMILTGVHKALSWIVKFSCHSLRKTFGYHAWKAGTQSVLLMAIYNHSSFSITQHYLGIDQQEKDEVYGKIQL
ncbi:MAG: tyrosine-type recombinase/integrase [Treponema sp.]|nr:tyrosine-type recombinase/integrase [Treponema sp.]